MTFRRTSLALLAGLALSLASTWVLDGRTALGVVLGYLLGASLSSLGALWEAHWLRLRPERALRAQVEAFVIKLAAVLVFAPAFRSIEALSARVDWRSFLVAFAIAVAVLGPIGALDALRASKTGRTEGGSVGGR